MQRWKKCLIRRNCKKNCY